MSLTGLVWVGPMALILAITSGLGGLALFRSHTTTRDVIAAKINAHEARCAALIDALAIQTVGGG